VTDGGNGQTKNLDIHDNNASWSNGGYANDLSGTDNNMNEEGLVSAQRSTNSRGYYNCTQEQRTMF
jgi:hypothetical protein